MCHGGDDSVDEDGNGVADQCETCDFVEERFIAFTYRDVSGYYGEGPFTFQVVVFEDGDILFNYESVHNLIGAVVGLELPFQDVFSFHISLRRLICPTNRYSVSTTMD